MVSITGSGRMKYRTLEYHCVCTKSYSYSWQPFQNIYVLRDAQTIPPFNHTVLGNVSAQIFNDSKKRAIEAHRNALSRNGGIYLVQHLFEPQVRNNTKFNNNGFSVVFDIFKNH